MTTDSLDIQCLTITELAGLLRTRAQLEPIDALDGRVASFCHLTAGEALDAAGRVSERRSDIGSSRAWP
jgi:hypothetical protein